MGNGFRLARVAGIDVFLDWSLLIIFALVTLSLGGGVFPAWHPDWSPATAWLTAACAAVLFFLSVLLHEMSHALVGRAQGIEVPRITLFVFGGMAEMKSEPHTWRGEFWMAIVGPVTSLLLGFLFMGLGSAAAGPVEVDYDEPQRALRQLSPLATLLFWLGPVNVVLGLFNLVPGFPLDGGRVLRAAMWGITGDMVRATRWASLGGQLFAWLLIASGLSMVLGLRVPVFGSGAASGLWLALIGWFLNNAAITSYRQLVLRETLRDVPVSRLMQAEIQVVPPDLTVQSLVDDYLIGRDQRSYPVVDDGRLVGLVCLHDVRRVPRASWDTSRVADIMTPAGDIAVVAPDDPGGEALNTLVQRQLNQLPVVEDGKVLGMIRREEILRWLSLYGEPGLVPRAERDARPGGFGSNGRRHRRLGS
jgi:Zn-dependent protease/CBS domain-containing protein